MLKKREDTPDSSMQKQFDEEISDINPFIDCNSDIALGQTSMMSSTFEADYIVINNKVDEKAPRSKTPNRYITGK